MYRSLPIRHISASSKSPLRWQSPFYAEEETRFLRGHNLNLAPNSMTPLLRAQMTPLSLFSHYVTSDSLWPHGLQHARPPCPSLSPEVCPSSCSLHWWCHSPISSEMKIKWNQMKNTIQGRNLTRLHLSQEIRLLLVISLISRADSTWKEWHSGVFLPKSHNLYQIMRKHDANR